MLGRMLNHFKDNRVWWVLLVFFVLQFREFYSHTQSFYFEDETEHIAPAWMMMKHGSKLYEDLSTNHQPLPILTSRAFLSLVSFNSLYLLVERMRILMMGVSFLGAVLLTWRFGVRGLVSSVLVESVKFYLFGYHLLAESLIVYPVMYLVGVLAEKVVDKKSKVSVFEGLLVGLSVFWVGFNWLPAWPFLILMTFWYLKGADKSISKWVGIGLVSPTLLMFSRISLAGWWQETVVNLWKYFLPFEYGKRGLVEYLKMGMYPLLGFLKLGKAIPTHIAGVFLVFALGGLMIMAKSRNRKLMEIKLLILYLLIILLNLRVDTMDIGFYTAFHVLPQFAGLTMVGVGMAFNGLGGLKKIADKVQYWIMVMVIGGVMIGVLVVNTRWWGGTNDKMNENYIQYDKFQSVGSAIKSIKDDDDTLLVGPLHGFIYVMADTPMAGRQNAYLPWAYRSPALRKEFEDMMKKRAPSFIYFSEDRSNPYYVALESNYLVDYERIDRVDGGKTDLNISKGFISDENKIDWKRFEELGFLKP